LKLIDRFWAESAEGARFEVLVYEHTAGVDPLTHRPSELGGASDYRLRDGRDLEPISGTDDEFQIVETGEIIRRAED
jgi:hypothetical protein